MATIYVDPNGIASAAISSSLGVAQVTEEV